MPHADSRNSGWERVRAPSVRARRRLRAHAADLDFELGIFAGSVASLAVLGAPELIVLTLSEFADRAYRIGRPVNPIVVVPPFAFAAVPRQWARGLCVRTRRSLERREGKPGHQSLH